MGCWWKWNRLVLLPARRVWIALSTRFLKSPKINGDGLLKLHDDIQTCGYEDVQVMWEMLTKSSSTETTSLDLSSSNISSTTVTTTTTTTHHRLFKPNKYTKRRRRRTRPQRPFWRIFTWTSASSGHSKNSPSHMNSGSGFTSAVVPLQRQHEA